MDDLKELFAHYPKRTLDRFKSFHSKNQHVYEEFKKLAFEMRETGRKKYSARTLVEVLRWHRDLKTSGDVFEINNDFVSIYVRLLIYHHHEFLGFFDIRREMGFGQKSEEQIRREKFVGTWPVDANGSPLVESD